MGGRKDDNSGYAALVFERLAVHQTDILLNLVDVRRPKRSHFQGCDQITEQAPNIGCTA